MLSEAKPPGCGSLAVAAKQHLLPTLRTGFVKRLITLSP